ncbi:SDR family NAD(P)-dependent oxidoreductase [Streptomyces sp. ME08-AFT2]|nr:SDR family NAD(P)-dependent oxidoreductase [Streptomyces sp. ME08-AFT2]MDX3312686.1 SDR family NAD(P)-dependent oxidoreductase [Streptomyces sp. ME08-AFT2]
MPEPLDASPAGRLPALAHRLGGLPEPERRRLVLDLVLAQVAEVLELGTAEDVQPDRAIRELGLRSLTAVQLLLRLHRITGVKLPTTAIYDYPTAQALADVLVDAAGGKRIAPAEDEEPVRRADDDDPVAVVGMACRYPGGVTTPDELWRVVAEERDAISSFPDDRGWDLAALADPSGPTASLTRHGGFLQDVALFDAGFFGISPREAQLMDPQQRLLLETSWEALERAGVAPGSWRGGKVGVFVGANAQSYSSLLAGVPEGGDGHALTGRLGSVLSGRIAYVLGLEGPAVTVDTACSSSLVAIHMAIRSLRSGESTMALAGGVTVMHTPELFVDFTKQGGLSADGRSRSYAEAAEGLGWSEGVGVLLLERLSDARRNGHEVLALLTGSATNQDGASNGLTAPSGAAQQRVVRQALADAGLRAADVDAVEGHGTGTKLGDPIEAQALLASYGQDRDRPLWLGSLKSNLGHTQAAAGVGGVMKMVLALRNGVLPKTLHVDAPSPHVDWVSGAVELLTEARDWPRADRPRRAGVSSFGVSGTNVHVIVQEAPEAEAVAEAVAGGDAGALTAPVPWTLSARTDDALRAQAARLRAFVAADPELKPAEVGLSLVTRRTAFDHRAAVVGRDRAELLAGLDVLASGGADPAVVRGTAGADGRVVFVFAGQGGQWQGMGVELLDSSPVFAERMAACERALAPYLDWSVVDVLRGAEGAPPLRRVDVVQPVLFALMVSLAAVWREHGVVPSAVVGHSQGEIAAACVAGALTLEDAAKTVALRAKAVVDLPGRCGMGFVAAPAADVEKMVERWPGRLGVAAVNSPRSLVVAGERDALEELLDLCDDENLRAGRVAADYASHSPQVEAVRERLLGELKGIRPRDSEIPLFSTVTADWADGGELDARYWYSNLRRPVRFADAVRGLLAEGYRGFVEVSPHPVLTVAIQQTAEAEGVEPLVAATLRRDESDRQRFTLSLAEVAAAGVPVDWRPLFDAVGARPVELPTYAFQRERYWLAPGTAGAGDLAAVGLVAGGHPLAGAEVELPDDGGLVLSGRVTPDAYPWLADHAVLGTVVVPGTAVLEVVAHAGARVGCGRIEELTLAAPIGVPADGLALRVTVRGADEHGRRAVAVHTLADGDWTPHASGVLAPAEPLAAVEGQWPPADARPVSLDGIYDRFAGRGFGYGPAFRGLRSLWRRAAESAESAEVFAEVELPEAVDAAGFAVHPALLDAATQAVLAAEPDDSPVLLPFSWSGVTVRPSAARVLRVRAARAGGDEVRLTATDTDGTPVVELSALRLRPASADQLRAATAAGTRDAQFRVDWVAAEPATAARSVVVGADAAGLDAPLHATLADISSLPDLVLAPVTTGADMVGETHRVTAEVLGLLREWLADERFAAARLAVVTRGAVVVRPFEAPDPAAAAVWGLVRSAQTEHPDRFLLVDTDGTADSLRAVATVGDEPQSALREGELSVARLARAADGTLRPPAGADAWRVDVVRPGSLDGIEAVAAPDAAAPLAPGQIRVAVRAAGLNFRDVLCALDMYPDDVDAIGSEAAGTVLEVGADVTDLAVGDRVLGMVPGGFGPLAVVDRRLVVPVPEGWTWVEAAALPSAFATARYALVDLAGVRPGDRVLVHAAAGGVGLAAVRLARLLGAEVFATASPAKHGVLRAEGLAEDHIASSRTTEFAERFPAVDVVLNSLAGELTDASLELLADGGRFVELGKTDRRDPEALPNVTYRAFDLLEAGPERIQGLLTEVVAHVAAGEVRGLPTRTWPLSDARAALRFMAHARHTGKIVFTVAPYADGTVLLTGAGVLGGMLARHLVTEHGARHLVLASRRGGDAPRAAELVAELAESGATARFARCDVTDRADVDALLASLPAEHPLTAVVHTAGVLDDGVLTELTADRLPAVLRPKADAVAHLHEATRDRGLSAFVLFSSAAATLGTPAQANYAAANAFLDALAERRRADGLPATSLAWGLWADATGLTGHLDAADVARAGRGGIVAMASAEGLALFDAATRTGDAVTVAARLDLAALRAGTAPRLLRGLTGAFAGPAASTSRPVDAAAALVARIAALPETERAHALLDVVRGHAADVLGYTGPAAVDFTRGFKELGFDSLTAVELRNRLGAATGLRLATTLVFDHPTSAALADHLLASLMPSEAEGAAADRLIAELARLEGALAALPADGADRARVAEHLRRLASRWDAAESAEGTDVAALDAATADELFDLIDRGIA